MPCLYWKTKGKQRSVVLAHHGKTDLHQFQAKHCSVSSYSKNGFVWGEMPHCSREAHQHCPDGEQKSRLSSQSSLDKTHIYHICEQPRHELNKSQLCSCPGCWGRAPCWDFPGAVHPFAWQPLSVSLKTQQIKQFESFFGGVLSLKSRHLLHQQTMKCI